MKHIGPEIIAECKKQNPTAQKIVYDEFANKLFGVCIRYVGDKELAKDLLHETYIKIFTHVKKFKWQGEGSFEKWMKTILINTTLTYIKKQKKDYHTFEYNDAVSIQYDSNENSIDGSGFQSESLDISDIDSEKVDYSLVEQAEFTEEELIDCITVLPDDFRFVFNMYVFEKLKHQEIATKLNIKEKTSKTRLLRARRMLQKELYKRTISKIGK